MACHDYGSCQSVPIPIQCQSLILGSSFWVCGGWRQYGPPAGPTPPSEGHRAPSGSGGKELPFLGLGEARPIPKGSDKQNLRHRGQANQNLS
jgi:hypothetical protein